MSAIEKSNERSIFSLKPPANGHNKTPAINQVAQKMIPEAAAASQPKKQEPLIPSLTPQIPKLFTLDERGQLPEEIDLANLDSDATPNERAQLIYKSAYFLFHTHENKTFEDYDPIITRIKAAPAQVGAKHSPPFIIRLLNLHACALLQRGVVYKKASDIEEAISIYKMAIQVFEENRDLVKDEIQQEHLFANLAVAYYSSHPSKVALAIETLQNTPLACDQSIICLGRALVAQYAHSSTVKDFQKALDYLEQQSALKDNSEVLASLQYLIGQLYVEKFCKSDQTQDHLLAEKQLVRTFLCGAIDPALFSQCHQMLAKLKDVRLRIYFSSILGSGWNAEGDTEKAQAYLDFAKSLTNPLIANTSTSNLIGLLSSQIDLPQKKSRECIKFHSEQISNLKSEDDSLRVENLIYRSQAYSIENRGFSASNDLIKAQKLIGQQLAQCPNGSKKIYDQLIFSFAHNFERTKTPYEAVDAVAKIPNSAFDDLEKAMDLFSEAIARKTEVSPRVLNRLCEALCMKIRHTEEYKEKDYQQLSAVLSEAVKHFPLKYRNRYYFYYAYLHAEKFKRLKQPEDYAAAVKLYRIVIASTKSKETKFAAISLLSRLCKRGAQVLPFQDVRRDLNRLEGHLGDVPSNYRSSIKALISNVMGNACLKKYETTNDLKDLENAISHCKAAADSSPPETKISVIYHLDAAEMLLKSPDVKDSFEASIYFSSAATNVSYVKHLKTCLRLRELWSGSRFFAAMNDTVEKTRQRIELAIGIAYKQRFLKYCNPKDLESAISCLTASLKSGQAASEALMHLAESIEMRYILERNPTQPHFAQSDASPSDSQTPQEAGYILSFNTYIIKDLSKLLSQTEKTPYELCMRLANYYFIKSKSSKDALQNAIKYYMKAGEVGNTKQRAIAKAGLVTAYSAAYRASGHLDSLHRAIDQFTTLDLAQLAPHHANHFETEHTAHLQAIENEKIANELLKEAQKFQDLKKNDEAILKLQEAEKLKCSVHLMAQIYLQLGIAFKLRDKKYANSSDLSLAIKRFSGALQYASENSPLRAQILIQLGKARYERGDTKKQDDREGLKYLEEAKKIAESLKNDTLLFEATYNLFLLFRDGYLKDHKQKDLEETFTHLELALSTHQPVDKKIPLLVDSLKELEIAAYGQNDCPLLDKLIEIYSNHMRLPTSDTRRNIPLFRKMAELLCFRGRISNRQDDILEAIDYYKTLLNLSKLVNSPMQGQILVDIGMAYQMLCLVTNNMTYLDKALDTYEAALSVPISNEERAHIFERIAKIFRIKSEEGDQIKNLELAIQKITEASNIKHEDEELKALITKNLSEFKEKLSEFK